MAELWFQVRLASGADATAVAEAYNQKQMRVVADYAAFRLERNPRDGEARTELGFSQWSNGQIAQAIDTFHRASEDAPGYDQPHYYVGVIYRQQNRLVQALQEFQLASRLNPQNAKAFGNLGIIYMGFGDLVRAETNLVRAIELNPADKLAGDKLSEVRKARALK
jgi:Flp pilus assembly protein TadD